MAVAGRGAPKFRARIGRRQPVQIVVSKAACVPGVQLVGDRRDVAEPARVGQGEDELFHDHLRRHAASIPARPIGEDARIFAFFTNPSPKTHTSRT